MALTSEQRAQQKADRAASQARMEAARAEARRIVATGCCPECGSKLRRNTSIAGWWQCDQLGSTQFRARPQDPPCNWQAFTE